MVKIILGANGQVGRALLSILGESAIGLDSLQANFENPEAILDLFERYQPKLVINAAAYTAVDLAEKEEALAIKVNGTSPGVLARWCAKRRIPFVHYSTDYVFTGEGTSPWNEDAPVSPVNAYGRSKLEGERQVQSAGGSFLIFRTSWVYDEKGKNFLTTMIRLGKEREVLQVVADQWGAPTYAPHLAQGTLQALEVATKMSIFPSGIYHLCNDGVTNWHESATVIFQLLGNRGMSLKVKSVAPTTTSAYKTLAKRPKNSRLNLEKTERIFSVRLPNWKTGTKKCVEKLDESYFS